MISVAYHYQESHFCVRPGVFIKLKYNIAKGEGHLTCRMIAEKRRFTHVAKQILPHRIAWAKANEFANDHKEVACEQKVC